MRRADPESPDGRPVAGVGVGVPGPQHHLLRDPLWWVAFLCFFGLAASWAFASPLFSVPDEPAHTVKAAAVVRGQLAGRKLAVPDHPGTILRGGFTVVVRVPGSYSWNTSNLPNCYIAHPQVPASCAPKFVDNPRTTTWTTWVGRYPPTYYAIVGWPSRFNTGTTSVYLMRLVGAALFAALLASAMACAWEAPRFRMLALGVVVAATPTTLFLAGGVNPNSLEIAAAICLWAGLGVAVLGDEPRVARHLLVVIAVSGALLAATRPASTLWVAIVVVAALTLIDRRRITELMRAPGVRITAAVVGVVAVAGIGWTLVGGALGNDEGEDPRGLGYISAVKHSLGRTPRYLREMVGVFGWRTTPSPSIVYWAWAIAVLVLVGLAVWLASRRAAAVVVALVGLTLGLPPLLEALQATDKGFAWQGRYGLPLAVGVPIVAALTLGVSRRLSRRGTARLAAAVVIVVAVGQVVAFYWALRRYTVGSQGPLFFFGHHGWSPPLPAWLLVLAVIGGSAALAVVTYRVVTAGGPLAVTHPDVPKPPERPLAAASHSE